MLLTIFAVLLACASSRDVIEPKFQVLTPDELMVEVPNYEDVKLVTFRIGVRRAGQDKDDLELGENDIDNNRVFIYDPRLKLKKGDVVNYLLAFRDKEGYQAQSGNYIFNGAYYKKSSGRRQRFRRNAETTTGTFTTGISQDNTDDTEQFNPVESRFGNPRHGGYWPNRHHPRNFNPWGAAPRQPYPAFPSPSPGYPSFPSHNRPPFGSGDDCHDHERWNEGDSYQNFGGGSHQHFGRHDVEYHCKICNTYGYERNTPSTEKAETTTEKQVIDIRFAD